MLGVRNMIMKFFVNITNYSIHHHFQNADLTFFILELFELSIRCAGEIFDGKEVLPPQDFLDRTSYLET